MTLRDDIATALRRVVAVSTGLGATWQYRKMTSEPDVEPRTYGTATDIEGHQSTHVHQETFQTERGVWVREERCSFRVSSATTVLVQGDQLADPNGVYWAVMGVASTGIGTVRYDLSRQVPLLAEGNRGGGV